MSATLIKMDGVPLAYDPASNLYWYTDLSQFLRETYQQQQATISALNIAGYTGFHMASAAEANTLASAVSSATDARLFTPTDYQYNYTYWTGRTNEIFSSDYPDDSVRSVLYFYTPSTYTQPVYQVTYHVFDSVGGIQLPDLGMSTWVAGNAEQAPVPEPGTFILIGTALAGWAGSRIRKRRI